MSLAMNRLCPGILRKRFYTCATIERLRARGLIHSTTLKEGQSIKPDEAVYAGFDPTARSLHLGNLLALISLLHFRLDGHPVIALIGGATGRIGDPSWRTAAKDRLEDSVIGRNIDGLKSQISGFFERSMEFISGVREDVVKRPVVKIVDNYDWYRGMDLLRFLDEVGSKMRVASLISRDSVKSRMQSEQGLSYSELTYQLLQAYDFLHLHKHHNCRLQIGGSDQWGNILSGLDLISKTATQHAEAHGLTMPLLVSPSSGEKMGKSAGNAKWLDPSMTSPFEIFQYFTDMSDTDAIDYLPKLSFRRLEGLRQIIAEHQGKPEARLVQRQLAYDVTALVHSEVEAKRAETASDLLFAHNNTMTTIDGNGLEALLTVLQNSPSLSPMIWMRPQSEFVGERLVDILASAQQSPGHSKNAIKQLIRAGGVSINGRKILDVQYRLGLDDFIAAAAGIPLCLVKTGKQSFTLLQIVKEEVKIESTV